MKTLEALGLTGMVCMAGALLLAPAQAMAQGRRQVTISTPGNIPSPGSGGIMGTFTGYSYGLGSLQRNSSGSGGDLLRSSVSGPASLNILRGSQGGLGTPLGETTIEPVGPGMVLGESSFAPINVGLVGPRTSPRQTNNSIVVAQAYLEAIGAPEPVLSRDALAIASLVPMQPSLYHDYMEKADKAFRAGNYFEAGDQFDLANRAGGGNDPESLLGLMMCQFSKSSYSSASFYLKQTIKIMPDLPLMPLRPKALFGSPNQYSEQIIRLQEYLRNRRYNFDAQFLLAFFCWFSEEQDIKGARDALRRVYSSPDAPDDLKEAVNLFWDGMVASGKASGDLNSAAATTSAPATSRPAANAVQAGPENR